MAYISTEDVKKIRQEIKKQFPITDGWKFSIKKHDSTGVEINILQSKLNLNPENEKDFSVSNYHLEKFYGDNKEQYNTFKSIFDLVNKIKLNVNRNEGDTGADYVNMNYFVFLNVGLYKKPFIQIK